MNQVPFELTNYANSIRNYFIIGERIATLERVVSDEVRVNMRLMQIVFPQKNFRLFISPSSRIISYHIIYLISFLAPFLKCFCLMHIISISEPILNSRPPSELPGVRTVSLLDPNTEFERRVKFSWAVFDMLQTSPATKLSLLQEPDLEKRYGKLIGVLEKGGTYLRSELKAKGVMDDEGLRRLREEVLADSSELVNKANYTPENYVEGNWVQRACAM